MSPGIGVDGLGRELGVAEPYCVDLGAWLTTQHEEPERWNALIRDGYAADDNLLWLKVTMRYQDCAASGLQPVLATELNAGTDPVQPSRVADCVLFELVAERPTTLRPRSTSLPPTRASAPTTRSRTSWASANAPRSRPPPAARARLELGARLLHSLGDDNRALVAPGLPDRPGRTRSHPARAHCDPPRAARARSRPDRQSAPNRDRQPRAPFLFNAVALARLIRA